MVSNGTRAQAFRAWGFPVDWVQIQENPLAYAPKEVSSLVPRRSPQAHLQSLIGRSPEPDTSLPTSASARDRLLQLQLNIMAA